MSQDKRISVQQAAEVIKDGSSLTFSGFTIWRRPFAVIYELIRQQRKGLHLIEVNGGPETEFLVGAGCVDIWESCWVGHELYGKYGANLSRKVAEKKIIVEDYSHAEMLFRFQAAANGAPYAITQTALGTDIHNPEYDMLGKAGLRDGKRIAKQKYVFTEDPFFDGGKLIHVPAAKVDICLMCVQQVGEEGTVRVNGQFYSDPEAARAADITIVVAEEIVPEEYLRRNSDQNTIASFEVDHIVECPYGAHPTGMFGHYDVDGPFLKDFYSGTRTQEGFDDFAKQWIHGLDHNGYLEKLGWNRILKLRANSAMNFCPREKKGGN